MLRRLATVLATLALLAAGSAGRAEVILTANLTTDQETNDVLLTLEDGTTPRPTSFGAATFVLNDDRTALSFTATVFNIDIDGTQTTDTNDNLIAAHIHAPALPGTNGGVRWGFFGAPFNDNNPDDVVITPFDGGVGFTISGKWDAPEGNNTTLAEQLPNLLGGLAYINFHTVQNGPGEIRGQIVPEPASLALLGLGLAGLAAARWSRRRARG